MNPLCPKCGKPLTVVHSTRKIEGVAYCEPCDDVAMQRWSFPCVPGPNDVIVFYADESGMVTDDPKVVRLK